MTAKQTGLPKQFRITPRIGKARHAVSYHDGVQTHKDGSPFFGLNICSNKRKLAKFVRELKNQGYIEK